MSRRALLRVPASPHLRLEALAAARRGRPLPERAPVPGCACPTCVTLAAGGDWHDAANVEDVVCVLAGLPAQMRVEAARDLAAAAERVNPSTCWPSPGVLALLAKRVPGALRGRAKVTRGRSGRRDLRPALDVNAARAIPILDVARRLGLGEPRKAGREWLVRCPLHEDRRPSLRLSAARNAWFCDPCAEGGDGIGLVMRARRLSFLDAVRELTEAWTR